LRGKPHHDHLNHPSVLHFKDDLLENQPAVDSGSPSLSNGDLDQLETMMDRLDMMHVSDSANLCSSLHSTLCKNQLNLKIS